MKSKTREYRRRARTHGGPAKADRVVQRNEVDQLRELQLRERVVELKAQHYTFAQIAEALGINRDTVSRAWNRAVEELSTNAKRATDAKFLQLLESYDESLRLTRARAFGARVTDPVTKKVTTIEADVRWAHVYARERRDLGAILRPTQQQQFNLQLNAVVQSAADGTPIAVSEQQAAELVRREFPGNVAPRAAGVVDVGFIVPPAHAVAETANDQDEEEDAHDADARHRPRRA